MIETLKEWYRIISEFTNHLRELPYGEDGKYIHILIGVLATALMVIYTLAYDVKDLNAVGLTLFAFVVGFFVEFIQRAFFGGTNTNEESLIDIAWVVSGSIPVSLIAVYFDISRWAY